jgi:enoyl-CoA hydratase/carnithine racemase
MDDPVFFDVAEGIANIRLNRPDRSNALDAAMAQALLAAQDPSVRAVTLTAEGRNFVAGGDFGAIRADPERLVFIDETWLRPTWRASGGVLRRVKGCSPKSPMATGRRLPSSRACASPA